MKERTISKAEAEAAYSAEMAGETAEVQLQDGPEVDEARAFLQATLTDLEVDERVRLWFETGLSSRASCC